MKSSLYERAKMFLQAHRKKNIWYRLVSVLAVVVVFVTTYMLVLPAITMEHATYCGIEEHLHTAECYSRQYIFTCGQDESSGHEHTDDCLEAVSVLTCTKEEHYHTDECYAQPEQIEDGGAAEILADGGDGELIIDNTPEQEEFPELSFKDDPSVIDPNGAKNTASENETESETETEEETTEAAVYYCGREAHIHTDECFNEENEVICGKMTHQHTEECLKVPETEEETTEAETEAETEEAATEAVVEAEEEITEAAAIETEEATTEAAETETEEVTTEAAETETTTPSAEPETESETEEATTEAVQQPQMNSWGWGGVEGPGFEDNGVFVSGNRQNTTETDTETEDETESETESGSESETETESESESETEPQYICGLEEHTHTEACYDEAGNLVCDLEEHTHTEECLGDTLASVMGVMGDEPLGDEPSGDEGTPGDTSSPTSSISGSLVEFLTSVTGSGTKYDPQTGDYETNLRFEFSMRPDEVVANGYTVDLWLPEGIIVPDDLLNKDHQGVDKNNRLALTCRIEKDASGRYHMVLIYDKEYVDDAPSGQDIDCHVGFWGWLKSTSQKDDGSFDFNFKESVELEIPLKDITYPENETFGHDISVTKTGYYTADGNKIIYTVTVSSEKGTSGSITLNDMATLDSGLTVTGVNVSIEKKPNGGFTETTPSVDQPNFTLNLPQLKAGESYEITYEYTLGEIVSGNYNVKNTVDVQSGSKDTGDLIVDKAETTVQVSKEILSKYGNYDSEAGEITWTIMVNSSGADITDAILTDEMFAGLTVDQLTAAIEPKNGFEIQKDKNGKVTGIHFTEIDGESNNQSYKIVYTQEAAPGWDTRTVNNKVTLSINDGAYERENGAQVPGIGSGNIGKELISYTAPKNGLITATWESTMYIPASGIDGEIVVRDWLYGRGMNGEDHWISKKQLSDLIDSLDWLKAEYVACYYDSWHKFSEASDDTHIYGLAITFPDGFGIEHKGETLRLRYETTCSIKDLDGTREFQNKFEDQHSNGIVRSFTYTQKSRVKKMNGDGSSTDSRVDLTNGKLTWKVKVYLESDLQNLLKIEDNLPEGVVLESMTFGDSKDNQLGTVVLNGDAATWENVNVKATYDSATNQVVLTAERKNKDQPWPSCLSKDGEFWVTYNCTLTDEIKQRIEAVAPGTSVDIASFTNKVTVWVDSIETPYGEASQTQTGFVNKPDTKKIGKTGSWNPNQHTMSYSLELNPNGEDLVPGSGTVDKDTVKLIDVLKYEKASYWDGNLGKNVDAPIIPELIQDTVKLYYAERDEYGNIRKDENGRIIPNRKREVPSNLWSWTYEKAGPENEWSTAKRAIIEATIPDEEAFVLEYSYTVDIGESVPVGTVIDLNGKLQNTATLSGKYSENHSSGDDEKWENSGIDIGVSIKGSYTFYKVDSTSYGQTLSGAEFTLYKYVPEGTDGRDADGYVKTDQVFKTENGKFSITLKGADNSDLFDKNTMYYVVETKAPQHYALPEEPPKYYFYFSDKDTSTYQENYPANKETLDAVDLMEDGRTVYCENEKEGHTYDFEKVDGEDTTKKLEGAVFTIFKYDPVAGTDQPIDKTYTTDSAGKFAIGYWDMADGADSLPEGGTLEAPPLYENNVLYYAVETTQPGGYTLNNPQKYYFYFSTEEASMTFPEGVSAADAKNLLAEDAFAQCENFKTAGVIVEKEWAGSDGKEGTNSVQPKSVQVQLWKKGAEGLGDTLVGTATLNKENDWRKQWSGLDDGVDYYVKEVDAPEGFNVTYKKVEIKADGTQTEGTPEKEPSNVTAKNGEKLVVINQEIGTQIEVEKVWKNGGNTPVQMQLYRKAIPAETEKEPESESEKQTESEKESEPVNPPTSETKNVKVTVSINGWENGTAPTTGAWAWIGLHEYDRANGDNGEVNWGKNLLGSTDNDVNLLPDNNWTQSKELPGVITTDGSTEVKYYVLQFDATPSLDDAGGDLNNLIKGLAFSDDGKCEHLYNNSNQIVIPGNAGEVKIKLRATLAGGTEGSGGTGGSGESGNTGGETGGESGETAGKKKITIKTDTNFTGDVYKDGILYEKEIEGDSAKVKICYRTDSVPKKEEDLATITLTVIGKGVNIAGTLEDNYVVFNLTGISNDCELLYQFGNFWPEQGGHIIEETNAGNTIAYNSSSGLRRIANPTSVPITTGVTGDLMPADAEKYGDPVTLSESNGWNHTWKNLPKADGKGNIYVYYVQEVNAGQDCSTDYNYNCERNEKGEIVKVSKVTVTNTPPPTPETVNVSVEKRWVENGENTHEPPEGLEITVYLYRVGNDKVPVGTVTLNQANNWQHTWTGLEKGSYYVQETIIPAEFAASYTAYYTTDGTSYTESDGTPTGSQNASDVTVSGGATDTTIYINNWYTPRTKVTVNKVWLDRDGKALETDLPESITVQLYRQNGDGEWDKVPEEEGGEVNLTESDSWSHTWENLPQGVYYVQETKPGGEWKITYEVNGADKKEKPEDAIAEEDENIITITNQKNDMDVSVEKIWKNWKGEVVTGDALKDMPDITVELWKKGETLELDSKVDGKDVVLGKDKNGEYAAANGHYGDNGWQFTWEDLPLGEYYVKESEDSNVTSRYTVTYTNGSGSEPSGGADGADSQTENKFYITNTEKTTEVTVEKVWKDPKDKILDASKLLEDIEVKVTLYRVTESGPAEAMGTVELGTAHKGSNSEDPKGHYDATGWQFTWEDLPLGKYYVQETPDTTGYTVTYNIGSDEAKQEAAEVTTENGTITVTNKDNGTEIDVEKQWAVEGSEKPITVTLYSSHTPPGTAESGAMISRNNILPMSIDAQKKGVDLNSTTSIKLSVGYWLNGSNQNVQRPEAGWIRMEVWQCDTNGNVIGSAPVATGTLLYETNWEAVVKDLPSYTVSPEGEIVPCNYLVKYEANGAANSIVKVVLMDNLGSGCIVSGTKPSSELTLTAIIGEGTGVSTMAETKRVRAISNGTTSMKNMISLAVNDKTKVDSQELTGSSWTYHWENLPTRDAEGKQLYYYVEEELPEGYTSEYAYAYNDEKDHSKGLQKVTIKNTRLVDVTVKKEWTGFSDVGLNTDNYVVRVMLYKDGAEYEPAILNKESKWSKTWENLEDGHEYTVKELSVENGTEGDVISNYEPTVVTTKDSNGNITLMITNKHSTETYTLPETGGPGTLPYTVGGTLLTAFAALLLYIQNKRRKEGQGTS